MKQTERFYLAAVFVCLLAFFPAVAGAQTYNASYRNAKIEQVITDLRKRTGYEFVYQKHILQDADNVTAVCHNATLSQLLDRIICDEAGLDYEIVGKTVILNNPHKDSRGSALTVCGTILDEDGETLPGASIRVLGTRTGAVSDNDGRFTISAFAGAQLTFSYIGYEPMRVKVRAGHTGLKIRLHPDRKQIDEVVVTGIVNRKANSFTGSVSSFSGDDLKKVGSQNVIKSLEALEPSMLSVTNLSAGSNPNAMPTLELNGTSSFPDVTGQYTGNPNQPLFILNGFESSLQSVLDLDMNLIKSVTILKDASAKAIYGSKAANGVVIVETRRPEAGKLRVYYNGGATLEVPDLTSYNLANSREKLQAELLSGQVYDNGYNPSGDVTENTVYNDLYKEVLRGVDTYWLSAPLRTGIGQKHTLSVDGGNENYIYGFGLSYNRIAGAMKGSDRTTFSGNLSLEYRAKGLSVQNILYVNYNNQNDPYHSFADYAGQNPYWRKYTDLGKPVKTFLSAAGTYYNPLWDDQWKAYNKTNYTEITDNFNADWTIWKTLRLVGRLNFTKNTTQGSAFRSPSLTEFLNSENKEKGSLSKSTDNSFTIGGDLNLTYSHTVAERHIFFYDIGTSFQASSSDGYAFSAYGFPDDTDYLAFAQGYKTDDKPSASEARERELSFLGIFNYSYEDRYLVDASVRTTGSSSFGRDKRWGTFWSAGIGWNIHNEPFIKGHAAGNVITLLKLRGSLGYSGAQNFSAYQTLPMYSYKTQYYYNGAMGAYLQAFPNTDLQWQSKNDENVGLDLSLWNKLNLTANLYVSTTKNSISQLTVAPSIGFTAYAENIGDIRNNGFDLNLSYIVFNIPQTRSYLSLNFSVAANNNKILKISDAMRKYNEQVDAQKTGDATVSDAASRNQYTRPMARYVEGRSLTAIWGVRSAGIDPLNGKEVYIKRNGEKTYIWDTADQVVIGDTRPKAHGTFGFSFEWRGFSLNTVCGYQVGGDYYNTTLVDKVENADIRYNVDRRYLYGRWKQAGNVSYFKNIADANYTKPTSRFVMKNNQLTISSINIGYDFRYWDFVKKLGLTTLKIAAYINDVAVFSTVKQERGTDYPFARNMNFSVTLNF